MREKGLVTACHKLREAAVGTLWRQWGALGATITGEGSARSIVDPEGLALASLSLGEEERRLWDVPCWWVKVGPSLLSVQRIKSLAVRFPESTRARLGELPTWRIANAGTSGGGRSNGRHQGRASVSERAWAEARG